MQKIFFNIVCLMVGLAIGGAVTFYVTSVIYAGMMEKNNQASANYEVMTAYAALLPLRTGDNESAIEQLEQQLDAGLLSISSRGKIMDKDSLLVLDKMREYRTVFPHKNKIPDVDVKINELLFSAAAGK